MRNRWWTLAALALAGAVAGSACGSNATGISLEIDPDPVQASRQGDGSFAAEWDAVLADLTGVGGTVESVEASVAGVAAITVEGRNNPAGARLPSPNMAVAPFARKLFHQSARFTVPSGQSTTVHVVVRFVAEDGQRYESTAEAPVTLR